MEYPQNPPQVITPNPEPKPGMLQAVAIITLVSGIINIMTGLGFTLGVVLGTLGIGLLCAPVTILPSVLGLFEVLYAVKLLPDPIQRTQPNQVIAILEICSILFGNVLSCAAGIIILVFYNDPKVKAYFAWANS